LAAAYARLLADPDPQVSDTAAKAWCGWEDTHVSLAPDWAPSPRYADPAFRRIFARLVTHYWSHNCFLADGEVLAGMPRLAGIPGVLAATTCRARSTQPGRFTARGPTAS
jgi:proline iminopeptidase